VRRKVQALHHFGTRVAVRGVEPGERVVLEGKQNVRPGGKVRVEAPPSTTTPQQAPPGGAAPELMPGNAASASPTNPRLMAERERL
jgi:membrane fusion protein, multidrug efflux system